jgi:hypothetical protein
MSEYNYNIPFTGNKYNHYENKFLNPTIDTKENINVVKQEQFNDLINNRLNQQQQYFSTGNSKPKKKKTVINVDSRFRSLTPKNIYGSNLYKLDKDPFIFNHKQSLIKIIHYGHNFNVNDRISINNVASKNELIYNPFSIKKNSFYIRVSHENHGISLLDLYDDTSLKDLVSVNYIENLDPTDISQNNGLNLIIPDSKQYYILNDKIQLDLYIVIDKAKGNFTNINKDLDSVTASNFIFDIPVNYINKKQKVYPIISFDTNTGRYIVDPHAYLIRLPRRSNYNYLDGTSYDYTQSDYSNITDIDINPVPINQIVNENTINIMFLNLYGIPLNYINADYPLSSNTRQGYHIIKYIGTDYYIIDVNYKAICENQNSFLISENTNSNIANDDITLFNIGGGEYCTIRLVSQVIDGYPNSYSYKISLNKEFHNISQVKLISTEFPNSYRLISNTLNNANNKIYWQNLDDGDYIYSISIDPGNYTPLMLQNKLELAFNNILRLPYINDTVDIIADSSDIVRYDNFGNNKYHIIKTNIDTTTDTVSFSAYKEILLFDTDNQKVLVIPDNEIIVKLEDHNLMDTDVTQMYIIVTNTEPVLLSQTSPNKMYQLIGLTTDNELDMILNTLTKFISTDRSINTEILFTDLQFNISTFQQTIITIQNGGTLNKGDFVYRALDEKLFKIDSQIDSNIYSCIEDITTKFILGSKLINIIDATYKFKSFNTVINNTNKMIVNHPKHNLNIGDQIIISNSLSVNNVPATAINNTHMIVDIIDNNNYIINLDRFSPLPTSISQKNRISIIYPDIFRIRFDFLDTLGTLLGFRNTGSSSAITKYSTMITNLDEYEDDFNYNSVGIEFQNKKNVLAMSGENYILMCSKTLNNFYNIGPVNDVFAKILLTDVPGTILFNTFVATPIIFDTPIPSLSELNFEYYLPNGNYFDFNGLDHSFTLEITELINYAPDTSYNSRLNTIEN